MSFGSLKWLHEYGTGRSSQTGEFLLPASFSFFQREDISDSKVFSFDLILAFSYFAYFSELEWIDLHFHGIPEEHSIYLDIVPVFIGKIINNCFLN